MEDVHVLSGRLRLESGKSAEALEPGGTMTFSCREPHTWHNPDSAESADVRWVIVPAPWDTTA